MNIQSLKDEFPRESVSWRAQTLTQKGDKALALAYIDARDVMDRLDEICGPENWQTEYVETAKGRVICSLSIFTDDRWITKSDGAGDTDVEGDKGGISDAFKRAAVHWGIGRYLYDLPNVWVPCESYDNKGKLRWSKFTDDPWNHVRTKPKPNNSTASKPKAINNTAPKPDLAQVKEHFKSGLEAYDQVEAVRTWVGELLPIWSEMGFDEAQRKELIAIATARTEAIKAG